MRRSRADSAAPSSPTRIDAIPAPVFDDVVGADLSCADVARFERSGKAGVALASAARAQCGEQRVFFGALRRDLTRFAVLLFALIARVFYQHGFRTMDLRFAHKDPAADVVVVRVTRAPSVWENAPIGDFVGAAGYVDAKHPGAYYSHSRGSDVVTVDAPLQPSALAQVRTLTTLVERSIAAHETARPRDERGALVMSWGAVDVAYSGGLYGGNARDVGMALRRIFALGDDDGYVQLQDFWRRSHGGYDDGVANGSAIERYSFVGATAGWLADAIVADASSVRAATLLRRTLVQALLLAVEMNRYDAGARHVPPLDALPQPLDDATMSDVLSAFGFLRMAWLDDLGAAVTALLAVRTAHQVRAIVTQSPDVAASHELRLGEWRRVKAAKAAAVL